MTFQVNEIDIRRFHLRKKFLCSDGLDKCIKNETSLNSVQAMALAIDCAYDGLIRVSPNPAVGCVILNSQGRYLSHGYHEFCGGSHAEINALKNLTHGELDGAHLIVTLEPCAHEGKTPSCAKHISRLPIKRVTYGIKDPNPLVAGQGAEILKNAHIQTELISFPNALEDLTTEIRELAEVFLWNQTRKKPYIALKWAQSLDGKMALKTRESQWITELPSRAYSHYLRAIYDATLVGARTILNDNPSLNIRYLNEEKKNKIIIVDPKEEIFKNRKNFNFLKFHNEEDIIYLPENLNEELLSRLYKHGLCSILVEGGPKTLSHLLKNNLWNRTYSFVAPILLGKGLCYSEQLEFSTMSEKIILMNSKTKNFGPDILFSGTNRVNAY